MKDSMNVVHIGNSSWSLKDALIKVKYFIQTHLLPKNMTMKNIFSSLFSGTFDGIFFGLLFLSAAVLLAPVYFGILFMSSGILLTAKLIALCFGGGMFLIRMYTAK